MDLHKFCFKVFAQDASGVRLDTFIPIFHRWIQTQGVEGMLIDVADYAHVSRGPGVVLVAHEANYSMDQMEGPLGLLYQRKTSAGGPLNDRLTAALRAALAACAKLESEPELAGRLRFKAGEPVFIANDRLHAPNTEEGFEALRPELEAALAKVYPSGFKLSRGPADAGRRLSVSVAAAPIDAAQVLARLT